MIFGAGTNPVSVTVGDFNGDGKTDLVTANETSNNVSVLLGTGVGSFGGATNFAAGTNPYSVAVGDFNGDGKADLATANIGSNNVSVLLGTGMGSFGTAINFAVGTNPFSVTVGDFNGDGKADLATANKTSSDVSVRLGTGTGSFGTATNFAVGTNPVSVIVGDLNGDGKADLVTANETSDNLSVLLGTGVGSFDGATNFAVGTRPFSVTLGDFNGDSKVDLATANNGSSNVSVLLGNGSGSFGSATNFSFGTGPISVTTEDFDGDGRPDLAVANISSNNVSIRLGTGTGNFGSATNFAVGTNPYSVTVGDFNDDGKPDLATANFSSNNVSVLLNASSFANLAASVDGSGNLIVTDSHGTGKNNQFSLSTDGTNLVFADTTEQFASAPSGWTLGPGNTSIRRPMAGFTGSITINGALGTDILTVNLGGGDAIPGGNIFFNGGESTGDSDELKVIGYTLTTADGVADVSVTHTGPESGNVLLAGLGTISFNQIEPLTLAGNSADLVITLPTGADSITLGDDGGAQDANGNTSNSSALYDNTGAPYSFEFTEFTNPTNSLTINRGSATDDLTVLDLVLSGMNAGLTIGAIGTEFDQVTFSGPITLASNKSLSAFATGIINLASTTSDLATSGTGGISLTTAREISITLSGSSITAVNGDIILAGNAAGGTAGNFYGVINNGLIETTGSGNISLTGRGGTGSNSFGVVFNATSTTRASGNGSIAVSGFGSGNSSGVLVDDSGTVSTASGTITLTGTAGPTADFVTQAGILLSENDPVTIHAGTAAGTINLVADSIIIGAAPPVLSAPQGTVALPAHEWRSDQSGRRRCRWNARFNQCRALAYHRRHDRHRRHRERRDHRQLDHQSAWQKPDAHDQCGRDWEFRDHRRLGHCENLNDQSGGQFDLQRRSGQCEHERQELQPCQARGWDNDTYWSQYLFRQHFHHRRHPQHQLGCTPGHGPGHAPRRAASSSTAARCKRPLISRSASTAASPSDPPPAAARARSM